MTMEEMQRQLARQQSRADIMNLMGRYQYYHTGGTAPWGCSARRSPCSSSTP